MSRRNAAADAGAPTAGQGPTVGAAPPAAPLNDAAAAATRQPLSTPHAPTSRAALEHDTRWVPEALQPAAMLLLGLARAAWAFILPVAALAYRLAVWSSPVLVWAFWKYVNWYLLGFLNKAQRVLKWGVWALSWFTKAPPPA